MHPGPDRLSPLRPADTSARAPVSLSKWEGSVSVAEHIALTDAKVRQNVSYVVTCAFVIANVLTLAGVAYVFHEDNANIVARLIEPGDRVITPHVIMTIVGATTVQPGALALTMGRYLFPGPGRQATGQEPKDDAA